MLLFYLVASHASTLHIFPKTKKSALCASCRKLLSYKRCSFLYTKKTATLCCVTAPSFSVPFSSTPWRTCCEDCHALHDILLLRTSAIRQRLYLGRRLDSHQDEFVLLATYRGGSLIYFQDEFICAVSPSGACMRYQLRV